VSPETLWRSFAHEHATVSVLAARYHISEKTVRRKLDRYSLPVPHPEPRRMIAVMDATRVGTSWILAVRDPVRGETVYAHEVAHESTSVYQMAHSELKARGFSLAGIVTDGRFVDVEWLFPGIPLQMCHFHQMQIVIRYLTRKPKLPAGIELLALVRTLPRTDEASFTDAFKLWQRTYYDFLGEKTIDHETGAWQWTHQRLRQAAQSIRAHLPILFTFQKYPELGMPNTTNSLDGVFKKGKVAIGVHAGLTHRRQIKLMMSLVFACE
jgi:hypothetical protein